MQHPLVKQAIKEAVKEMLTQGKTCILAETGEQSPHDKPREMTTYFVISLRN